MKKALSLLAITCSICIQAYTDGVGPYHKQIHPAKTPEVHIAAPKPAVKNSDKNNAKRTDGDINNPPSEEEPLEGIAK